MSAALGTCQRCKGDVKLPSLEGFEEAAHRLDNEDSPAARGAALSYLWMAALCLRGFCVICQPSCFPRFGETAPRPA